MTATPNTTPEQQVIYVKAAGNGYAVASLIVGLLSVGIAGALFILFPIGWAGGLVGFVLGVIGWRKARRDPMAGRKTMAIWGTILSIVAFGFGCWGAVVVQNAVDKTNQSLNCLDQAMNSDQLSPDCQ